MSYGRFEHSHSFDESVVPSYIHTHEYSDLYPSHGNVFAPSLPFFSPKKVQYIYTGETFEPDEVVWIKQQMNDFCSRLPQENADYMAEYSTVKTITPDDCADNACDKELIGQKGLFATKDLPKHFVLGPYSGLYIESEDHLSKLLDYYKVDDILPYMFGMNKSHNYPRISAFRRGNRISLVNTATNYKHGLQYGNDQKEKRQNVMGIYAKTTNNPNPVIDADLDYVDAVYYKTIRPVKAGEQFLTDYGPQYWGVEGE